MQRKARGCLQRAARRVSPTGRGRRYVWTCEWRDDGTRVFSDSASAREFSERCGADGGLVYTGGGSTAEVAAQELPFFPDHQSLWRVSTDGRVATWRPDGSRWMRLAGGSSFRHESTGEVRPHPIPQAQATAVVKDLRDLSLCGGVLDMSIRRPRRGADAKSSPPAGGASQGVGSAELEEVRADAMRVRVECGAVAECSEAIRAALCTMDTTPIDFKRIRRQVTAAIPHDDYQALLCGKVTQAEDEFQGALQQERSLQDAVAGAANPREASIDQGVEHLLYVLRFLALYSARHPHATVARGPKGSSTAGADVGVRVAETRPTLFRTHFLSLPFNPLGGLHPLWTPQQAAEYLSRTAGFVAAYEAARNVSPGYTVAFDTWAEALVNVGTSLRRHLESTRGTPRESAAGVAARQRERDIRELLYFGSAGLNAFISWSSVRPGGYPLSAASPLIAGVINGVWGSYDGFVKDLIQKARVQQALGGWVWVAVNMAAVRSHVGDVKRHSDASSHWRDRHAQERDAAAGTTEIVPMSETAVVLQSGVERVRGRILGYDLQVITTTDQVNPLTQGWYPLLGVELWEDGLEGRSIDEYITAWLQCVDWRLADFQLRTCYKDRLQAKHKEWVVPYAGVQPLGADAFHAIWLDILGPAAGEVSEVEKVRSASRFQSARKHLSRLTATLGKRAAGEAPPFVTATSRRDMRGQPAGQAEGQAVPAGAVQQLLGAIEAEVEDGQKQHHMVRIARRAVRGVTGEADGDGKKQTLREAAQAARDKGMTIEEMMRQELVEEVEQADEEGDGIDGVDVAAEGDEGGWLTGILDADDIGLQAEDATGSPGVDAKEQPVSAPADETPPDTTPPPETRAEIEATASATSAFLFAAKEKFSKPPPVLSNPNSTIHPARRARARALAGLPPEPPAAPVDPPTHAVAPPQSPKPAGFFGSVAQPSPTRATVFPPPTAPRPPAAAGAPSAGAAAQKEVDGLHAQVILGMPARDLDDEMAQLLELGDTSKDAAPPPPPPEPKPAPGRMSEPPSPPPGARVAGFGGASPPPPAGRQAAFGSSGPPPPPAGNRFFGGGAGGGRASSVPAPPARGVGFGGKPSPVPPPASPRKPAVDWGTRTPPPRKEDGRTTSPAADALGFMRASSGGTDGAGGGSFFEQLEARMQSSRPRPPPATKPNALGTLANAPGPPRVSASGRVATPSRPPPFSRPPPAAPKFSPGIYTGRPAQAPAGSLTALDWDRRGR